MKIYLVTDMEGVAGITNYEDWCDQSGYHYRRGLALTTLEANAAVEGFFEGGATDVVVIDGHGKGGLDVELLDSRVSLVRGRGATYPAGLDSTFDAMAWVGQHAKAGTPYSHLTHTMSFDHIDIRLNGISMGEFGLAGTCGLELGVPSIFAAGEEALGAEAQELVPGIHTVSVKRGLLPDGLDELSMEAYKRSKLSAIHLSPERARQCIRTGARNAMEAFLKQPGSFQRGLPEGPYTMEVAFRGTETGLAPQCVTFENTTVQGVMNDYIRFSR